MGLRPITFCVDIFGDPPERDRSRLSLTALMYGLSLHNRLWLEYHKETPTLYDSDVIYCAEENTENWQDIPTTLRRGYGDCEDLACWRIAEHWLRGVRAMPFVTWRPGREGNHTIYHALVRLPNGYIEDPSRSLGMNGHPMTRQPVYIGKARLKR